MTRSPAAGRDRTCLRTAIDPIAIRANRNKNRSH
jgi:hypothetical protein